MQFILTFKKGKRRSPILVRLLLPIEMVISITVSLQEVLREGKKFKWNRPEKCPKCEGKLWGHGFVARYFSQFKELLWIKRYRCFECRIVIILRPDEYWPRIRSRIVEIYEALKIRLRDRKWPPWVSRQRALHWLQGFYRFRRSQASSSHQENNLISLLDQVYALGTRFV